VHYGYVCFYHSDVFLDLQSHFFFGLSKSKQREPMPHIKVNDINMYYRTVGEGTPLVMIMGFTANSDWWPEQMIADLAKDFRLILFDNRGSGRSDIGSRWYTMKRFADDTIALMDLLNIDNAHILGVSMGGMIAQEIAINYPHRVNQLILACTGCGPRRGAILSKERLSLWKNYLLEPKIRQRKFTANIFFSQEYLETVPIEELQKFAAQMNIAPITAEGRTRQLGALLQFNSYSRLPSLKNPTLIIAGSQDYIIPIKNSHILATQIPNSQLLIFDGPGHAFLNEVVDDTTSAISTFLLPKTL
jgi:pimeloyl-ACP methyl ester carboxylesterase